MRVAGYRAQFLTEMLPLIRCRGASDPTLRARTDVTLWESMAPALDFMATRRTSVFREPFDCSKGMDGVRSNGPTLEQ
jgi:hypothetical protein